MAPGIGKRFSTISSILGLDRSNKPATGGHNPRTWAQDDHNIGDHSRSSSGVVHASRYANFARQLPRRKPRKETKREFRIADQVMHAAHEMMELRFWQDYGAWADRTHWSETTTADHVEERTRRAECVVLHASERSCVTWCEVSQALEKEQAEMDALAMQGVFVGAREFDEGFPYFAEVKLAVVRVFGRGSISAQDWVWELHEYVRRKMVQTFVGEYNPFQEMIKRREWDKMAEWLHRDLFQIIHAFHSTEPGERYKMETALLRCSNFFFTEFPRISEDGVKHFYPRKEWLDRPSTPPEDPTKPIPEQALKDLVENRNLVDALGGRTSDLASLVTRNASRLRRGRPTSFGG